LQLFFVQKKGMCEKATVIVYFLGFIGALEAEVFAGALTGFIGTSQQTSSHPSPQSHGVSIKTTRPHSSHLYCSPFFLAKKSPSKNISTEHNRFLKI
jgi:hypothetical protein